MNSTNNTDNIDNIENDFKNIDNAYYKIYAEIYDSKVNKKITIHSKWITYINITNDLDHFVPTIVMTITTPDINLKYFNKNGIYLNLHIIQPALFEEEYDTDGECDGEGGGEGDGDEEVVLNSMFIINDFKIMHQEKNNMIIQLEGVEFNILRLLRNINYANDKSQGPLSPFNIIKKVLGIINYSVNSESFPYTDSSINFINAQNMTAKDIIEYCLERAITPTKAPLPIYFYTSLLDSKGTLLNPYNKNNIAKLEYYNTLSIKSVKDTEGATVNTTIDKINTNVSNKGDIQLYSTRVFNNYNHLERKWTQTTFPNVQFLNKLSDISFNKNLQHKYQFDPKVESEKKYLNDLINIYPNFSEYKIYNVMRNIQICSNDITFIVRGHLKRDCGQPIMLYSDDDLKRPLLVGVWFVYRCSHIFENLTYTNQLACFRTIGLKEKND